MKKHLFTVLLAVSTLTFLVPISSVLAKRKTCKAIVTIWNKTGKEIKIKKIQPQRKGGTIGGRTTFITYSKGGGKVIKSGGDYFFKGSFKIVRRHNCTHKRLWNVHYNRGNSPFVKVAQFKWISGKSSNGWYKWRLLIR